MPCGYLFSHPEYSLYLSTTFSRVKIEFYSRKKWFSLEKGKIKSNKRQKSAMLFLWKHVPDMFLVNWLSLSLHWNLVVVEDELERDKWGVLSTWWRSQGRWRTYLARCTWGIREIIPRRAHTNPREVTTPPFPLTRVFMSYLTFFERWRTFYHTFGSFSLSEVCPPSLETSPFVLFMQGSSPILS